ncbi:AAA family ATPase [Dactylosporangium sp. CA-092794]|uniref:AAA family ATPase n=1 Tax=Dactylosporangium sp. CA-092794 TaxID=3239929 RepID=UPI003D8FF07D
MTIERLQAFYGFTRMPFGRNLAPGMLHRHGSHAEAVARITWCVTEHALGVVTGEVGAGKTVAVRAALTALDPTRHTIIYLGNPTIGARGIHHAIVTALGGLPRTHMATLIPQTADALAAEHAERGRTPILVIDEATSWTTTNSKASGCSPTTTWTPHPRSPASSSANPPSAAASNSACSPPSTNASPCATPSPR